MRRTPNNRHLSVYLMKEDCQEFDSAVKEDAQGYDVSGGGTVIGKLYVKPIPTPRPSWFSFFDGHVPGELADVLGSRSISAAFLVKHGDRIFAFTFGYGRSLLVQEMCEERFGLKVVLNSIHPDKIRIVDRKNLDTMLTQTRTQTSRKCPIAEFGLDVQQILLKAVSGEPKDESFANSVSGADSLSISCELTLETIGQKCDQLLNAFSADEYQKSFPWVNNIAEVKDRVVIGELNDLMIEGMKEESPQRLFLAIPDIVEWTSIAGFKFSRTQDELSKDILLSEFLETVEDVDSISPDYLKRRHVLRVHEGTEYIEEAWPIYRCVNCELHRGDNIYVLTEGSWYQIRASFVEEINARVNGIRKHDIQIMAQRGQDERAFNKALSDSDTAQYALMDGKMIYHGGGHSQIEFCDVYSCDRKMIHAKKYSSSSVMNHLFAQGANSARAFFYDVEFRKKVNEHLPPTHQFDPFTPPKPSDHEIVFAIISETAERVPENLPFLSKITLARTAQELQAVIHCEVSVAGIKIAD